MASSVSWGGDDRACAVARLAHAAGEAPADGEERGADDGSFYYKINTQLLPFIHLSERKPAKGSFTGIRTCERFCSESLGF